MSCSYFYAGASIRACHSVGRHLVALEEDNELFSDLLAPMVCSPVVHLHQSLSLPTGLKVLTVWRLFQPRSRKDVPVSKSALVVMEFCDILLCTNFQFLT
jgi:hypothetical protein